MEPPGTAPGSDPLITSAFMSIVRVVPNRVNIGRANRRGKGRLQAFSYGAGLVAAGSGMFGDALQQAGRRMPALVSIRAWKMSK